MLDNSKLDFRATFHLETVNKTCSISDFLMPSGWDSLLTGFSETSANVEGLFSISSLMRGNFYNQVVFSNNDFSIPQTDGDASPVLSNVSGISLPLDTGGNVINDTYTLKYKTRIKLTDLPDSFGSGVLNLQDNTDNPNYQDYRLLFGASPQNLKLQIYSVGSTPTGHEGVYNITSITMTGSTNISPPPSIIFGIHFHTDAPSSVGWTANANDRVAIILEKDIPIQFAYNKPNPEIEHTSTCIYSQMTVIDSTDYTKLFPTMTLQPTINRSWVIQYPNNVKPDITTPITQKVIIGAGTTYNNGANIYTGYYNIALTASYSVSPYSYFTISDSVTSSVPHKVECSLCLCKLKQCYDNIAAKYNRAVDNNPSEEERLRKIIIQLDTYLLSYMLAQRCGTDTGSICTKIKEILQDENCNCDIDDDEVEVHEVLPSDYFTMITVSSGKVTFGSGDAGFPAANLNDVHVFTVDSTIPQYYKGDHYLYNGTSWVFQYNNMGIGTTGATGATGTTGANGVGVLYNNLSTAIWNVTNSPVPAASYTLPANQLSTNGSFVEINAVCFVEDAANAKPNNVKVKLLYDSNIIAEAIVDNNSIGKVPFRITARLYRYTSTIAVVWKQLNYMPSGIVEEMPYSNIPLQNFATTHTLSLTVEQNSVPTGDIADFGFQQFMVTYYKQ